MDSSRLNDWIQAIGIFAVVASLVFVGLQLKQSQDIAIANQYQARLDSTLEFKSALLQSDVYWDVQRKLRDGEVLDDIDERVLGLYAGQIFDIWENMQFQHVNGYVPREHWIGILSEIEIFAQRPETIEYWKRMRTTYRDSFIQIIDPIIQDAEAKVQ